MTARILPRDPQELEDFLHQEEVRNHDESRKRLNDFDPEVTRLLEEVAARVAEEILR